MKRKMHFYLSGVIVFLICGVLMGVMFPAGGGDGRLRKSARYNLVKQAGAVLEFIEMSGGKVPESLKDMKSVLSSPRLDSEERRRLLSRPGLNQSWKPVGWHMDDDLFAVYSDYVIVPLATNVVAVMERPAANSGEVLYVTVSYEDYRNSVRTNGVVRGIDFYSRIRKISLKDCNDIFPRIQEVKP